LISSSDPDGRFELTNEDIRSQLNKLAEKSLTNINNGTHYYLRRITMSQVKKILSKKSIREQLLEGKTVETILADSLIMSSIIQAIREDFFTILRSRVETISDFELGQVENMATVAQFKSAGLLLKLWGCYGPNPCEEYCIPNNEQGYVPLDFVYESAFGGTLQPQAHGRCHCGLEYNDDEVLASFNSGKFQIWYGN
jgi:hypothetical protein